MTVIEMTPDHAYQDMQNDPHSVLVDVRTKAEWVFVGLPDLSHIKRKLYKVEWKSYPAMAVNMAFAEQLSSKVNFSKISNIYFICRSGARSLEAAHYLQKTLGEKAETIKFINIVEGFEGDLDANAHRGTINGWKGRNLPWSQN